jgi:N-acetylmuramoyl-L-alanine amidase-like protein
MRYAGARPGRPGPKKMHWDTRAPPDLRRRRLLWSSAALLAASAGLQRHTAYAEEGGRPAAPPAERRSPDELPVSVKPREAWGANPPVQPYVPHTPSRVTLHHTGAPWHGQPPVERYLRSIQTFHTGPEREWEDIAYHFLIDLEGGVWAGRPPEVRGNPSIYYDSTGFVLICFLGDYSAQEPSEVQVSAASRMAAWLIRRFKLPADAITGHCDHAPTSCPGANVYRLIREGAFAGRVQAFLKK